jgi:hypothetical protein
MSVRQEMLLEILERSCQLKIKDVDYDRYFASINALDLIPKEERDRDTLRRMLYCIWDTSDLNEMVSTLASLCYDYAMSLEQYPIKGEILYICEAIKAAPEMVPLSSIFADEVFQVAINSLYSDRYVDLIIPVAQTFNSLPSEQKEFLLNHIWKLAEKWGKHDNTRPEETQYGIIYKRIVDAIQTLT